MTRINLVPVTELMDQHLIAEYREITMIPAALKKTINSKQGLQRTNIPKAFTLNKGHITFFYNKGEYLFKRYSQLVKEMKTRVFQPNKERIFPKKIFIENGLFHNWRPSQNDFKLIRKRIEEKIKQRPNWYRKNRIPI